MRNRFMMMLALIGMFLACPGCSMGGAVGSMLIDGGLSLVISLVWSLISGSLSTPAA
jgi:hypothetical protein